MVEEEKVRVVKYANSAFKDFYGINSRFLVEREYKPGKKTYRNMSSINKIMQLFLESGEDKLYKDKIINKTGWVGPSAYVQHERIITNFELTDIHWSKKNRPFIELNQNGIDLKEEYGCYRRKHPELDLSNENAENVLPDFAKKYFVECLQNTISDNMSLWKNVILTGLYLGTELGYVPKYGTVNRVRAKPTPEESAAIIKCCGYIGSNSKLEDITYFEQLSTMLLNLNLVELTEDNQGTRYKYFFTDEGYTLLDNLNIFVEIDKDRKGYENTFLPEEYENACKIVERKTVLVEVKLPEGKTGKVITSKKKQRTGKKRDYEKETRKKAKIGELGEQLVMEYERKRLEKVGVVDIDEKLIWSSKVKGDGLGYDIQSYDAETGETIFIEVKTTEKDKDEPFFISKSEVEFSAEYAKQYYVYRVFKLLINTDRIKFYKVKGSVRRHFILDERMYQASLI